MSSSEGGAWRRDTGAVTEVLSYVISFGVLSAILLLGLLGFAHVREQGEAPRAQAQAQSIANAVAAAAVQASLLAEQGSTSAAVRVEVPDSVYGRSVLVRLDPAGLVIVEVAGIHHQGLPPPATAAAPLQGREALDLDGDPGDSDLCPVPSSAGPLDVRIGVPTDVGAMYAADCGDPQPYLSLIHI